MNTITLDGYKEEDINSAALMLKQGKLIAFPTETVYGLGADIFNSQALNSIFLAKGRPADNPLIAHIGSLEDIDLIVSHFSDNARKLAQAFFPGPLTLILPVKHSIPKEATANLDTIGIRMPNHPIALALLQKSGPVCAPSANLSGKPSPTKAIHVLHDLDGKIDGILDGGSCEIGIESTVLLVDPIPTILRPGIITAEMIAEKTGIQIVNNQVAQDNPLSPGIKYRHYAPKASIHLASSSEEFLHLLNRFPQSLKLSTHITTQFSEIIPLKESTFYDVLRSADAGNVSDIIILFPHADRIKSPGLANRVEKASNT
jgi:L-threonylcarbamoyladenylate synthase